MAGLRGLLGEYVGTLSSRVVTRAHGNETEVRVAKAGAVGKRLIWSNETKEGDVFDDDVLKALSSRDPIRDARWHHQRPFTFSMHPVKHAGRAIAASGGFCGWGALPPIPGRRSLMRLAG